MKLIIQIGPDTFGVTAKSKKNIQQGLNSARNRKTIGKSTNGGHLGQKYRGRFYTKDEISSAYVFTLKEFFNVLSPR
jgi:hypothetical protein